MSEIQMEEIEKEDEGLYPVMEIYVWDTVIGDNNSSISVLAYSKEQAIRIASEFLDEQPYRSHWVLSEGDLTIYPIYMTGIVGFVDGRY